VLASADTRGIDSHGIARLHTYFELLQAGRINPTPNVRVVHRTPSTATVDGDNGLGLVVGPKANELAMEMAAEVGSGWVSVRNTNHFGIAGYYCLEATKRDMIGVAMTNTTKLVAPFNGIERMLGTNPIAVAIPAGEEPPIVCDMATSAVAYGKVRVSPSPCSRDRLSWCHCLTTRVRGGLCCGCAGRNRASPWKGSPTWLGHRQARQPCNQPRGHEGWGCPVATW